MKKLGLKGLLLISACCCYLSGCGIEVGGAMEEESASVNEINKIYFAGDEVEFDIRPQDDFYGYVNAEYLWSIETPYDANSAGTFSDVAKQVDEELDEIINEVIESDETYEKGSDEQIIRAYYDLATSGNYTDKKVYDDVLQMIDDVQNIDELVQVFGKLSSEYGVNVVFTFGVDADIYDPSRYTLALTEAQSSCVGLKDLYDYDYEVNDFRDQLEEIMVSYGMERAVAQSMADDMAYIWIDIACETNFDRIENYDEEAGANKYTVEELDELLSNVDVNLLLTSMGFDAKKIAGIDYLYVADPVQMQMVNEKIVDENLNTWKEYAKCAFMNKYSQYRPAEYAKGQDLFEAYDEDMVLSYIKNNCYSQLSNLYMDKYYTDEMDAYMNRMKDDITASYIDMINDADWLSDEGKKSMIQKFNNIEFYFGGEVYRELKIDEANLIADNVLQTEINVNKHTFAESAKLLDETPDYSIWNMGAQEVNAYYNPNANSIYITTAIMHAPFFDLDADYYTNLGALGVVICHELSHGFDSNGIKYDAYAVYNPSWISAEDDAAFQEIVAAVDAHYDEYALLEVYHVNGEKTVAENLADIGGMECILNIADSTDEYKHVFEGYAKVWCTLYENKDLIDYLDNDVHSPSLVRVNAVISCFQEFYDTYDVVEGDGMYIAPEDRVIRW